MPAEINRICGIWALHKRDTILNIIWMTCGQCFGFICDCLVPNQKGRRKKKKDPVNIRHTREKIDKFLHLDGV